MSEIKVTCFTQGKGRQTLSSTSPRIPLNNENQMRFLCANLFNQSHLTVSQKRPSSDADIMNGGAEGKHPEESASQESTTPIVRKQSQSNDGRKSSKTLSFGAIDVENENRRECHSPSTRSSTCSAHSSSSSSGGRKRYYSISAPPMPWFGIDIGGTLTKLTYFEPTDHSEFPDHSISKEVERVSAIKRYLLNQKTYGETGQRDEHLEIPNVNLNGRIGTLHFIRFLTSRMPRFVQLAKQAEFASHNSTVCATGGGAQKYAPLTQKELDLSWYKFDEMESLIFGLEFCTLHIPNECYYWENPLNDETCRRLPVQNGWGKVHSASDDSGAQTASSQENGCADTNSPRIEYPYLVVNMGSGISVVAVTAEGVYRRVSGSSIGGGFFHGLCCLLCGVETFEQAIQLASRGDNRHVDKLVRDIYGGSYEQFNLSGDIVAASFGHMVSAERRAAASKEDLARAALVTVCNNIGSIAINCAVQHSIKRVFFVGNFLRVNPIASRHLAYSMDYWSKGERKALFMNHEGYFGSIGCLQRMVCVSERIMEEKYGSEGLRSATRTLSIDDTV